MTTPQCPVHGLACSTAYNRDKCRCSSCVQWSRDYKNSRYKANPVVARNFCPVLNCACSTAYKHKKCRCDACVADYHEHQRPRLRWRAWKQKGGVASFEEYQAAWTKTHCDCCGVSFEEREKTIDHCHETGKLRGTLCHNCNVAEGLLGGIDGVNKLREYLNG